MAYEDKESEQRIRGHPLIYILYAFVALAITFISIYFFTEIMTRVDMTVMQKTIWEFIVLGMPVLGQLLYALFGGRSTMQIIS